MVAQYTSDDFSFQYPENWTLIDRQDVTWPKYAVLQSPGGAYWSAHVHPPSARPIPLASRSLQTMRSEYPELEFHALERKVDRYEASGYDIYFYCLDFLVRSQVLALATPTHVVVLWYQGEDREFDGLSPIFEAIAVSLLRGLA